MTDQAKKRTPREMPISTAINRIRALDRDYADALRDELAEAARATEERVKASFAKRRASVLKKVHPSAVEIVLKEAGATDAPAAPASEPPAESDPVPAGVTEYIPGPAARAARGGR